MRIQQKPIIHGRDHRPGGVDPIPGIGGLAFDTYPQAGNWLYAETDDETGAGGSPSGLGIELDDFSAGGISIGALGGGDAEFKSSGGGRTFIRSTDTTTIESTGAGGIFLRATTGDAILKGQGVTVQNDDGAGEVVVGSATLGLFLRVSDNFVSVDFGGTASTPGTQLFLIDATGTPSYHILSGATWVADL